MLKILLASLLLIASHSAADPHVTTDAEFAIIMDADSGSVIFEKNAHTKMAPSSMSKMMTAYVVFDQIKNNNLKIDDQFKVSEKAWRMEGSRMFLPLGQLVSVKDLLLGLVVQSGNDAAVSLAEGVAGSEDVFGQKATEYAKKLGMNESNFVNATGLPHPEHYTTCYDLALLALRTIKDFPEEYKLYSQQSFEYNGIIQQNRNELLSKNNNVDGLKTGFAKEAGYGITISGTKNDRRLLVVVNGLKSPKQRILEAQRLLAYGFLNTKNYVFADGTKPVGTAKVWQGTAENVDIITKNPVILTLGNAAKVESKILYNAPIQAPVQKDQQIGTLQIMLDGKLFQEHPLYAATTVEELSFHQKWWYNLKHFLRKL